MHLEAEGRQGMDSKQFVWWALLAQLTEKARGLSASEQLLPRPAPSASRSQFHHSLVGGRA
jgi:hypothetical protein